MFNRIEKLRIARSAVVLAGLVMGSLTSAAFAADPAHMVAKNAQLSAHLGGAYGFAMERGNGTAVYQGGIFVGQDPDAGVRFNLLRDTWVRTHSR
jgi:hypothetical protein